MSLNGVQETARLMNLLAKDNASRFLRIWASIPSGDRQSMLEYLTPLVMDLVTVGHADAVSLGLTQLNYQRAGIDLPTVSADAPSEDAIRESLRFLLTARGTDTVREDVWGMIDRHIRSGHRDTVMLSAFAAGNGYARKPEPGACSFCLMMASRGAAYATEEAALRVGAPGVRVRGNQKKGDKYHDHCKCEAVEVSEGFGLPPEAVELRKLWMKTFYPNNGGKPVASDFEATNAAWKEAVEGFRVKS